MEILKLKNTSSKEWGFSVLRSNKGSYFIFKFSKKTWMLSL